MTWLAYDTETNGLLHELDRIHCLCLVSPGDPAVRRYHDQPELAPRDGSMHDGLAILEAAEERWAHNGQAFDEPALRKVYPGYEPRGRLRDSLIIGRTIWPDEHLADLDAADIKRGKTRPKGMVGRHSLEAWGHRLRDQKGDKPASWAHLTPEMLDYCAQDVVVLDLLVRRIQAHQPTTEQIELEQAFAPLIEGMTSRGFRLDQERATAIVAAQSARRAELTAALRAAFPDFEDEYVTPKRQIRKTRITTFNPNSRAHVARALTAKYGWKPRVYTPTGQPQVDEAVMSTLPYPEAKLIHERLLIQKRLGTIAEGKTAWLKLVSPDGRVRGRVTHNAAVTSRCTHSRPNLGNVEAGSEMRACWVAAPGHQLVIVDASGLEARIMGHYAARFDGGDLAKVLLEGDVHARNQESIKRASGLDVPRVVAKQVFYGICYGAQDDKVGRIIGRPSMGRQVRNAILGGLPGLGKLVRAVTADAVSRGWLRLPDGRRAWVRAKHAALNTLVQGTGAILMKRAIVDAHPWTAGTMVAFVHDEIVCEVREGEGAICGAALAEAIVQAGERYKLRVPLAAHVSVGYNWSIKT